MFLTGDENPTRSPGSCSRPPTFAVPVQDVQRRDEEFVGVLLLVPRQVPGVSPHQVQQLVRDVGGPVPRVKLLRHTHTKKEMGGKKKTCQE